MDAGVADASFDDCGNQRLLPGIVLVEGTNADPGLLGDPVDAGLVVVSVDEIFRHNLGERPHGHWALRSIGVSSPGALARGEALLHVAPHAAGRRGQVALLLQKNGIQSFPNRPTDFPKAEDAGVQPKVPAEVIS